MGKTSLVLSLVGEEFPDDVPAKAEEITIPGDVTPEKVPTHIVDYSGEVQSEEELHEELQRANVVCIVYSVVDQASLQSVTSRWLPLVRDVLGAEHTCPVVLVGNKTDLTDSTTFDEAVKIMHCYAEIETCVECSAKSLKNVSEMFYYAQKVVLHPTSPLYVPEKKDLTDTCRQALTRVFKICDMDNDGILNDYEINQYQKRCFNAPLPKEALDEIKEFVKKNCTDGLANNGLTLQGFLYLQILFIQRGRHETTWTTLRKFGYDDNLKMNPDYLYPQIVVGEGCSTELTYAGYQFLQNLFEKYDKDHDGCLSPAELQELFSTYTCVPWGLDVNNTVCTNAQNWITFQGYLAQWTLTTYMDLPKTLELLAYLGYSYDHDGTSGQRSAIHITRQKSIDIAKNQPSRNVFLCHVIGPQGVGKTHLLQGLLGRNLQQVRSLGCDQLSAFAINTVTVYGTDKYLLMREIDADITTLLLPGDLTCDVACLVYDVTDVNSFQFCAATYQKHFAKSNIPVLMVACKSEQRAVTQLYEVSPEKFCRLNKLPPPQPFSAVDLSKNDIYSKLAAIASYPSYAGVLSSEDALGWLKLGAAAAVITGLAYLTYKVIRLSKHFM